MKKKVIMVTIWVLVILFCIVPIVLFILFPVYERVDREICYNNISKISGIKPNYNDIVNRISKLLIPGMTKEQVNDQLSKIGPFEIIEKDLKLTPATRSDIVLFGKCSDPNNDIKIHITYDSNSVLKYITFG